MTESAGQELAERDTRTPAQILATGLRSETFREQIAMALPPNVSVDRFVRAAVTAIMQPDSQIATADRESVILAAIRCAQDGLLPDGREAAIAVFAGKATYLPMIGGLRKALADYGWTLRTRVVYEGDDFSFAEEPAEIRHVPTSEGNRGELKFAYAIATHRDGRRIQRVVFKEEIEKRKAIAKTKNVWDKWPAEMWEKTAGHILFDEVPLSDVDEERARVGRIMAAWQGDPSRAVEAIYGADGTKIANVRELPPGETPATDVGGSADRQGEQAVDEERAENGSAGNGRAAAAPVDGSSSEPSLEDEPALEAQDDDSIKVPESVIESAAQTVIESKGKTIAEILALETGAKWIDWALRNPDAIPPAELSALTLVVEHRAPELWAAHAGESA